jgi:uncharacterized protein (DUF58 family)
LYIKQYQQETNLDVILLVDSSASMNFGTLSVKANWGGTQASRSNGHWTKFDHATATAVAVAYLSLQQGDRVGVAVFADEIRTMVKRSSSRGQWRSIVNTLNVHPVDQKTNFAKVVEQALSKVQNRAMWIVISDFFEDLAGVRTALARLRHRRHDVVLLQTLDRQEMRFDYTQPAPFEGLEDEGRLRIDPRALRQAYLETLQKHNEALAKAAIGFGFDYLRMDTHESVGPALGYLLARRNAQIKRSKSG